MAEHAGDWPITASIGIATLGTDESSDMPADAAALMRAADAAMYEAKRRGKNTVVAANTNGAAEAGAVAV